MGFTSELLLVFVISPFGVHGDGDGNGNGVFRIVHFFFLFSFIQICMYIQHVHSACTFSMYIQCIHTFPFLPFLSFSLRCTSFTYFHNSCLEAFSPAFLPVLGGRGRGVGGVQ